MNNEGIFWFSFRNLRRTIHNIMALFGAVNDDFDEMETAVIALGERMDNIESTMLDPSVNTIYVYDALADSNGDYILDSDENRVESTTVYHRV